MQTQALSAPPAPAPAPEPPSAAAQGPLAPASTNRCVFTPFHAAATAPRARFHPPRHRLLRGARGRIARPRRNCWGRRAHGLRLAGAPPSARTRARAPHRDGFHPNSTPRAFRRVSSDVARRSRLALTASYPPCFLCAEAERRARPRPFSPPPRPTRRLAAPSRATFLESIRFPKVLPSRAVRSRVSPPARRGSRIPRNPSANASRGLPRFNNATRSAVLGRS